MNSSLLTCPTIAYQKRESSFVNKMIHHWMIIE
jgi:hypothetical protein